MTSPIPAAALDGALAIIGATGACIAKLNPAIFNTGGAAP